MQSTVVEPEEEVEVAETFDSEEEVEAAETLDSEENDEDEEEQDSDDDEELGSTFDTSASSFNESPESAQHYA